MKIKNIRNRFQAGSALVDFLAGRLGAPECWADEFESRPTVDRVRQSKHLTCDTYGHTRPGNTEPFNKITKQH
jgi:hypothetical protein